MVARVEESAAERVKESVGQCRHHWVIGTAGGSTSKGVCRLCGTARQFNNFIEGTDWSNGEDSYPTLQEPALTKIASVSPTDEAEEEV